MIYTNVPLEHVIAGGNPLEEKPRRLLEAKYRGELVVVSEAKNGMFELERLISTNPKTYLDRDFAPGSLLNKECVILESDLAQN